MTTNREAVNNWIDGIEQGSPNLRVKGDRIYSYRTTLAEFTVDKTGKRNGLIINRTNYTHTTSTYHLPEVIKGIMELGVWNNLPVREIVGHPKHGKWTLKNRDDILERQRIFPILRRFNNESI